MKKSLNLFLAFVIAFFAFPFTGQTAFADAKVYDNIEDGEYEITIETLHEEKDEESSMASYLAEETKLTIDNGQAYLTVTLNNQSLITLFQIEGQDAIDKQINEEANTRDETFEIEKLESLLTARVKYEVPGVHKGDHNLRLSLKGLDKLPIIEDSEQPDTPEEPEKPEEDPKDESLIQLDNGFHTINASYINVKTGGTSTMARYIDESVFLNVHDASVELTVTITDDETVTKLQINDQDAIESKVDGTKRYETFKFDNLKTAFDAYTEYQVVQDGTVVHQGNAEFEISFDEESVQLAGASDKPGTGIEEPGKPEQPEEPAESPKEPKPTPKPHEPKKEDLLTPDKAYEIDYVIKHEDGTKESTANDFFKKPALLLEKDGKTYVQLTITNGDMVKDLRNKYGPAILVKENDDGSITVQLRVDHDLSDMVLEMRVIVPGLYDEEHKALLIFDKASKKEIPVAGHILAGTSNPNNDNGPTVEDGIPTKPEFGEYDENGQTNGKTDNPKTGDTSGILLYTLLLIGSLIPLGIQLKRRFA